MMKSQDNVIKGTNNLLTFHKNKKVTRNISYVTLYNKKKSLPNSKSNISAKIKNNEFSESKMLKKKMYINVLVILMKIN